ncbi:MAG: ABC transporter [Lentisphaerae bacterium RIFOXYC12_FULL_60_16]|nr:MAG: ABC transporter [Lentisphaerae bacterium RIFOXYC12_FULL_60_16]OGV72395.1 MAG: ABC transporter [Lentisphaerae bacterium RIFOXYA12_FULL_60_10]OGV78553.1 MAG: ABC transporter [Lentisphaerae bacterium RIFOXYB12_FULL_60_10]
MTSEPIIRTVNISKIYKIGEEELYALRDVSLEIRRNEYVSIMGPSGSGKSTFFNMVGALDKPSKGDVFMAGYRLTDLSPSQLAWVRCHNIGYVFQSFNLIPTMTALENVAIARIFSGRTPSEARKDAAEALGQVGLSDRLEHVPGALSGGQQQRVAIARAIVNKPSIILADEPTGNLDLHTGEEIIKLLSDMKTNFGITIITATHDTKMLSASDTVVWIKDGRVDRVAARSDVKIEVGSIDGSTLA